jgi:FkbH-like protein
MKLHFVSNTVTQVFKAVPAIVGEHRECHVTHGGLSQVAQYLMSSSDADVAVVILDFDYFIDVYPTGVALARLAELEGQIRAFRQTNATRLLLSNIVMPPYALDFNQADTEASRQLVGEMNRRIAQLASEVPDLAVLDLFGVMMNIGVRNFYRPKNKFVFQAPYSPSAIEQISLLIGEKVTQFFRPRAKVCVLDADNTLWGGVLGEEGAAGVKIDHNYPGIVYRHFQSQLLKLKESGVLLALVTKNNEQDIFDLFSQRTMPLALADFAAVKANWGRKSESIAALAQELNLGLSSFVFIDDSAFEIDEVQHALPEVQCVRFDPDSFSSVPGLLDKIPSLHALRVTDEDRAKTEQYRTEQSRQATRASFDSIEEYIGSLDISITCSVNRTEHAPRITQLINKTNQFNLTCRRHSESEVAALMRRGLVFDFQVRDKFGDMGIVGVLIVVDNRIENFLLSCRVLGRKIEDKILAMICRHPSTQAGLEAVFEPGPKNMQVEDLFDRFGFVRVDKLPEEGTLYRLASPPDDIDFINFDYAAPVATERGK